MSSLAVTPLDDLVVRATQGDHDAFAGLVDRTRNLVCSIAMAVLRDVDASQDVAQDVYLAVWRDLRRLRSVGSFLPWLRQMTRNRAHHVLRSQVRHRRVFADHDPEVLIESVAAPSTPGTRLLEDEQRRRLHDREHRPPVNQPGERHQRDPERIIGTARVDAALLVKRQLLAQKKILGGQVRPRSEAERYQPEGVGQQPGTGPTHGRRRRAFPHGEGCHNHEASPACANSRQIPFGQNICGSQP